MKIYFWIKFLGTVLKDKQAEKAKAMVVSHVDKAGHCLLLTPVIHYVVSQQEQLLAIVSLCTLTQE